MLAQSGRLPLPFLRGRGLPDACIDYIPSLFNQAIEFYSCFISYNHSDKSFAKRLYEALQGSGILCWLDEKQMLPGDDIHEGADCGIRLWKKCCSAVPKKSLTSWWVDNEIDKAFAKEQALIKERKIKVCTLIPLALDSYLLKKWENGKATQVRSRPAADLEAGNGPMPNLRPRLKRSSSPFEPTSIRGRSRRNRDFNSSQGSRVLIKTDV